MFPLVIKRNNVIGLTCPCCATALLPGQGKEGLPGSRGDKACNRPGNTDQEPPHSKCISLCALLHHVLLKAPLTDQLKTLNLGVNSFPAMLGWPGMPQPLSGLFSMHSRALYIPVTHGGALYCRLAGTYILSQTDVLAD